MSLDPDDESLGDAGAADEHHEHGDIAGVMAAGHDPAGDGSETGDGTAPGTPASAGAASDLPLGAIPGGAGFGNLVHDVLEHIDFTGDDLDTDLRERVEEGLRRNPWPVDVATLVDGLHAVIATPLGPMFAGRRLREFAPGDRLAELSFELRLGEGGRHATDRDVGALALRHLAGDDPLRPWAEQVASGPFGVELAGHLTGSIDSVFRVNDPADPRVPARFVVVDYKTNKLSERGREPLSIDYRPDRLAPAMAEHHYPMQALLYSVALHRYLRWRLPDYEPGVHLGGIAYLFVRGLAGAATPVSDGSPHGVFAWQVPSGLVIDLSDLLDGRELTR
ncbi:MAG: PD-(D/E)XK nuclease family protein [Acidimicrobiia bacterium]|nr:PD-(D/E)XK nuclease family protein [Acidimicrobiia bacterium]